MSLHLSATTGERVTPAMLLGETETDTVESRGREAKKKLKRLEKRMKKAGI